MFYPSNYRSLTKKKGNKMGVGGCIFKTVSLNGGCLTKKHGKNPSYREAVTWREGGKEGGLEVNPK